MFRKWGESSVRRIREVADEPPESVRMERMKKGPPTETVRYMLSRVRENRMEILVRTSFGEVESCTEILFIGCFFYSALSIGCRRSNLPL